MDYTHAIDEEIVYAWRATTYHRATLIGALVAISSIFGSAVSLIQQNMVQFQSLGGIISSISPYFISFLLFGEAISSLMTIYDRKKNPTSSQENPQSGNIFLPNIMTKGAMYLVGIFAIFVVFFKLGEGSPADNRYIFGFVFDGTWIYLLGLLFITIFLFVLYQIVKGVLSVLNRKQQEGKSRNNTKHTVLFFLLLILAALLVVSYAWTSTPYPLFLSMGAFAVVAFNLVRLSFQEYGKMIECQHLCSDLQVIRRRILQAKTPVEEENAASEFKVYLDRTKDWKIDLSQYR